MMLVYGIRPIIDDTHQLCMADSVRSLSVYRSRTQAIPSRRISSMGSHMWSLHSLHVQWLVQTPKQRRRRIFLIFFSVAFFVFLSQIHYTPATRLILQQDQPKFQVPDVENVNLPQNSHINTREDPKTDKPLQLKTKKESQPVTSVLHPNTPELPHLNPEVDFVIKSSFNQFDEYEESFPQHGKAEPGRHYRLENTPLLTQQGNREIDSVLIICVFNDAKSWSHNRTMTDFFELVGSFNYPKEKVSIAMLTSSMDEFIKAKERYQSYIYQYPQLSVIFRNDFAQGELTRGNRHQVSLQANRRRMIARYRNYALMTTLETWHQHVLWLDADIKKIPGHLLPKMVQSGLDILTPICYNMFFGKWINYDQNAWVGQRIERPAHQTSEQFVPGPLRVKLLNKVDDKSKPFAPLDSVGATMLYVRADVHRQGVIFPAHYVIGSEWGREGYDGIETEGLCYSAHFLGFKCWGMVNESIVHTEEF